MLSHDGIIGCDKCGCSADTGSEERAVANGWLVDHGTSPPGHFCPVCRERAEQRGRS